MHFETSKFPFTWPSQRSSLYCRVGPLDHSRFSNADLSNYAGEGTRLCPIKVPANGHSREVSAVKRHTNGPVKFPRIFCSGNAPNVYLRPTNINQAHQDFCEGEQRTNNPSPAVWAEHGEHCCFVASVKHRPSHHNTFWLGDLTYLISHDHYRGLTRRTGKTAGLGSPMRGEQETEKQLSS